MTLRRFALLYSFLLMLILIMVLLGYRQFVAMPKIEQGLAVFQDRELSTLQLALNKEISFLKTINYDYSVWKDAYEFIQEYDQEFIDDNFPSDTFTSLKIDGVFIFDDKFNQIWGKGFDYDKNRHFDLPELNLINFPHNQKLFPAMNSDNKVPQNSGFLNTSEGPVMFSATQARNSDRSGEPIGVVVFVRKIRPGLIKSLSEMSQLGLFSKEIKTTADATTAQPLKGSLQGENFAHKRQRLILDINNKPLILLNIEHYHSEAPVFFDNRTLITVLLLSTIPMSILLFVNIYLVEPVSRSTRLINKMLKTNQLRPLKLHSKIYEIDELINDFNQLIHTIEEQQTELEQLALLDDLTTIANRRAFEGFFAKAWSSMQRTKLPMAVLMCDIDYFKLYNDNTGHQAGDDTLKQVAQALAQRMSRSGDLVARYGGEEFVVVLEATSLENMKSVIDIVLQTVRNLKIPHPHSQVADIVTISVGAAIFNDFSIIPTIRDKGDLVKTADQALYRAKKSGRNSSDYVIIS